MTHPLKQLTLSQRARKQKQETKHNQYIHFGCSDFTGRCRSKDLFSFTLRHGMCKSVVIRAPSQHTYHVSYIGNDIAGNDTCQADTQKNVFFTGRKIMQCHTEEKTIINHIINIMTANLCILNGILSCSTFYMNQIQLSRVRLFLLQRQ